MNDITMTKEEADKVNIVIPNTPLTPYGEALSRITELEAEIEDAKKILRNELDRDGGNETLHQLAVIASNGLYWRNREYSTRGKPSDCVVYGNQHVTMLIPDGYGVTVSKQREGNGRKAD